MIINPQLPAQILSAISNVIDIKPLRIFIFGSIVNGNGTIRSDIDIGIVGKKPIELDQIANIRESIENISTLRSFDLVDFSRTTPEFQEVALQHIEVLHEPE